MMTNPEVFNGFSLRDGGKYVCRDGSVVTLKKLVSGYLYSQETKYVYDAELLDGNLVYGTIKEGEAATENPKDIVDHYVEKLNDLQVDVSAHLDREIGRIAGEAGRTKDEIISDAIQALSMLKNSYHVGEAD